MVNGAAGLRVYGFDSTEPTVMVVAGRAQGVGEGLGSCLVERDGASGQLALVIEVAADGDPGAVHPDEPGGEAAIRHPAA